MQKPEMLKTLKTIQSSIGKTKLMQVGCGSTAIYMKDERSNPTGTVKDRAAIAMIHHIVDKSSQAELDDLNIIEYSGGSLALSLAKICADINVNLHLALGSWSSAEFIALLSKFGAKLYFEKKEGFWPVMELANELSAKNPSWKFLNQHCNENNISAHTKTTGIELIDQLQGRSPDIWLTSVGSGASFAGVFVTLRGRYPNIEGQIITPSEQPFGDTCSPNGFPKYQGSGGLGNGRKQKFISTVKNSISRQWCVSFPFAIDGCREVYQAQGELIGSSAGANFMVCKYQIQRSPDLQIISMIPGKPTEQELRYITLPNEEWGRIREKLKSQLQERNFMEGIGEVR